MHVASVSSVSILLQQKGIDITMTNAAQKTALHNIVALDAAVDAITALITFGVNINARDNVGNTPLHIAATYGRLGNAKVLMAYGADITVKNNVNETARNLAVNNGHVLVVDLFDMPPLPITTGKGKELETREDVKTIRMKDKVADTKLAEKESQIADLELEIARLQSETMSAQINIEQLEQQKVQLEQKVKSLTDENSNLVKDREDLFALQSKFNLTWVPDDFVNECLICNTPFTLLSRRHHCRLCGRIFCSKCTSKKAAIPSKDYKDEVRVCDKCFEVIQRQQK